MAWENNKRYAYYLKTMILSLCTAAALTMDFSPQDTSVMALNAIYPDLLHGFGNRSFIVGVIWAALFYGAIKINEMKSEKLYAILLVCFFIAVIWTMGKSFSIDNTLNALYCSYVQILKTIIYMAGITYLLFQLSFLFKKLLDVSSAGYEMTAINSSGIKKLYHEHPFGFPLIILLIGMLPHLVLSYPTRMSHDARSQLGYYFGLWPFTSHHPPFSSWLMGKTVSLGLTVGGGNLGVFLYCVMQYLVLAFVIAYLIYTLKVYLHAPKWLQVITLLITLISPYYAAYVGIMVKDLLYSYCLLLFVIEMSYILQAELQSKKHIIILCVSGILTILLRNNGKYVIYPAILVLVLFSLRKVKVKEKVFIWMAAVSIVLFSVMIEEYFLRQYVQVEGSIAEALSLPFQQTARYAKEYGNEITLEEQEVIAQILDYDNLASLYDPEISDPVKGTFRRSTATKDALKAYMQIWLQQFLKHPWCYAEATLNQNYFLLYPLDEKYSYFTDVVDGTEDGKTLAEYLNIQEVDSNIFQGLRTAQELYVGIIMMFPIIGMFSNVGFYNLLLLFLVLYAIREKCFRTLILAAPLLFTDLIVIAAPYAGPRYAFPVIYSMPCVIAFYIEEKRRKLYE